jgi:iron complex outermembrane receptor protein
MLLLNSVRTAPWVRSAVAVAVLGLYAGLALAATGPEADGQSLAPVIVTAIRTEQPLQLAPVGATVITAEQIERSGASDANEAIRKIGGVASKSDLNNGRENRLDLRGYGETASANVVVLVDGIRISENEMVPARLSAIPVALIERIEIVRGGSSVAWGEGASAGVINVVLKQGQAGRSFGQVGVAVESFRGWDTQASGQWSVNDILVFDGAVRKSDTNGYRDNGAYEQGAVNLGAQLRHDGWVVRLRAQHEDQSMRLPGSITLVQFRRGPRQTSAPDDYGRSQETRYSAQIEKAVGDWTAHLDLGSRERRAAFESWGNPLIVSESHQDQVSPRLTHRFSGAAVQTTSVLGYDWQHWTFDKGGSQGLEIASQDNGAWFLRSDIALPTRTRVTLGMRQERVTKEGDYPGDGFYAPVNYVRKDKLKASEAGISQTVAPGWDVYGRLARSYRLPNVDENRLTPSAGPLRPQRNQDKEIGVKWRQGAHSATVRYFRQKTVDEIAYDDFEGANANIDPTRRQGVEIEGRWQATSRLILSGTWQSLSAKYREGPLAGREVVLVSPRTGTLRANYQFDEHQSLDVGLQYAASMRYSGDAENQCGQRVPSSTLLDARYAWSSKMWTWSLSATNLTDRDGYNYGYLYMCGGEGVYPYAGRVFKASVSRQF